MEKENIFDDDDDNEEDKPMTALSDSDINEVENLLIDVKLNYESEEYR